MKGIAGPRELFFVMLGIIVIIVVFIKFDFDDLKQEKGITIIERITELEESKSIYEYRITKLEQYKTSTEPIISGLNDEILELRHITDEFRAQIKGLQKEVLIGIQEGYNGQ